MLKKKGPEPGDAVFHYRNLPLCYGVSRVSKPWENIQVLRVLKHSKFTGIPPKVSEKDSEY